MNLKQTEQKYQKLIQGFKKGYKPRTNIVKDKNGSLPADSCSILNRWKNYFCQLLKVQGINEVMQTEMHTTQPLVLVPNSFEAEIATEKLIIYKSPHIDHILTGLMPAGGNTLHSENHKLTNSKICCFPSN
jgi:hypothetical protein